MISSPKKDPITQPVTTTPPQKDTTSPDKNTNYNNPSGSSSDEDAEVWGILTLLGGGAYLGKKYIDSRKK